MKYFLIALSLVCAFQASQAIDFRQCVEVVLDTMAGIVGKVDGFLQWHQMVLESVDFMDRELQRCNTLAENDPPSALDRIRITSCRTNARAIFGAEMVQLGNLFVEMGLGSVELSIWFVREMGNCVSGSS